MLQWQQQPVEYEFNPVLSTYLRVYVCENIVELLNYVLQLVTIGREFLKTNAIANVNVNANAIAIANVNYNDIDSDTKGDTQIDNDNVYLNVFINIKK